RFLDRMRHMQRWQYLYLNLNGKQTRFTVTLPVERLGKPSGTQPVITSETVEFDAADRRVRVRRISYWQRRWMKLTGRRLI
ncbi:MAG: hypothetical protein AAFO77_04455, partial [Pseudomonadota bacterium]